MDKDKQIQFLKDSHDAIRELAYQTGVRDEREACARLVQDLCDHRVPTSVYANTIRARGEK